MQIEKSLSTHLFRSSLPVLDSFSMRLPEWNKVNRFRLWIGVTATFALGLYYDDIKICYQKYLCKEQVQDVQH